MIQTQIKQITKQCESTHYFLEKSRFYLFCDVIAFKKKFVVFLLNQELDSLDLYSSISELRKVSLEREIRKILRTTSILMKLKNFKYSIELDSF